MNLKLLLAQLKEIQRITSCTYTEDDAQKVYNLLNNKLELAFEQSIFGQKVLQIKQSIAIEDKDQAFRVFKKALTSIISIIDGSAKEFKK